MRHRIVTNIGLGNPDPVLLDNQGSINKEFGDEAIDAYFSKEEGFDFQIETDRITIGIEPAYQYERLKLVSINKNKINSFMKRGKAWGPYGSGIASNIKYYGDYKLNCKFTRFVDRWHPILFKEDI